MRSLAWRLRRPRWLAAFAALAVAALVFPAQLASAAIASGPLRSGPVVAVSAHGSARVGRLQIGRPPARPVKTSKPSGTLPAPKPVPRPTPAPAPSPAPDPAVLTVSGGALQLAGQPYHVLGFNAYELPTDWGVNNGCGGMSTDTQLDSFFASMPAHSMVRFWAWQGSMAYDARTHQINWAPLDRVFAAAAAHHDFLVVSLAAQGGSCDDGHWKDQAWYSGGYTQVHNDDGLAPLSYDAYVTEIVSRYAGSPALGMWEPVSEPEASDCPAGLDGQACSGHQVCPDEAAAAAALRYFFDHIGAQIHALDPGSLVESGFLGSGQCGTTWTDYQYVGASPGIDVLSYHDYYPATDLVGGDQWNGIAVRIGQAKALHKPIIGGELGILGGSGPGCVSDTQRAADIEAKYQAQVAMGSAGVLVWDWVPTFEDSCSYDTLAGDPVLHYVGPH